MKIQELIVEFLNKSYDSGWISGKIEAGGSYDADAQSECIAQRDALQAMLESRITAMEDTLGKVKRFLEHGPEFPYHLLADTEELQEIVEQVLGKEE